MEEIINFIKELGFPIAVTAYLLWQNNKQNEQHKEEMLKMTDALNNNTVALIELKDKIGGTNNESK